MKEAFDLIRKRLEKILGDTNFEKATQEVNESFYDGLAYAYGEALSIVSEVEAEYINKSTEHINKSSDCSSERECDNCKHKMKGIEEYPCAGCIRNATDMWEQETNADHIRKMNDVELAEFFNQHDCICDMCGFSMGCLQQSSEKCKKGFLDWLKSPVDNRKEQG